MALGVSLVLLEGWMITFSVSTTRDKAKTWIELGGWVCYWLCAAAPTSGSTTTQPLEGLFFFLVCDFDVAVGEGQNNFIQNFLKGLVFCFV